MSFGFSPSDVVLLVQLAWTTVQNSRKACGEYAELTCEITSLHANLRRLERETANPESPINRPSDTCREELAPVIHGCEKALDVLDRILEKYNAMSDEERSKRKLWKAVRFGNGELANVKDLRLKLIYYTSNLSLFLNMVNMGSMGIVEKQMYEAGGDLKAIRRAVNGITAHLMSGANKEGSILTDYGDDDKAVWRAFRRELVKGGFSSEVIREHKDNIQAYVEELGSRGILDDKDLEVSEKFSEEKDEVMGSFESKSGAAREALSPHTATTAHFDSSFGSGDRDPRENRTFPQQKQIAPAPLTTNSVSDKLPFTTQADAKINSVVEGGPRGVEKVDDKTIFLPCWWGHGFVFQYYNYVDRHRGFLPIGYRNPHAIFEVLSNPLEARGETLEFQGARGFRKVAEVRIKLLNRGSKSDRKALLRLSPLFNTPCFFVLPYGRPGTIISELMRYGRRWINRHPEKWRITKWPLPREKTELEGDEDGIKDKRTTSTAILTEGGQVPVPPHANAVVAKDTQDPLSTTKEVKTNNDGEI